MVQITHIRWKCMAAFIVHMTVLQLLTPGFTLLDGRGRQEVCQEEAREPKPGSGPGHRALLPFRYVRP